MHVSFINPFSTSRLIFIALATVMLSACSSGGGDGDGEGIGGTAPESGVLVQFGLEGSDLDDGQVPNLDADSTTQFFTGTVFVERGDASDGTNISASFGRSSRRPSAGRSLLDTCSFGSGSGREFFFRGSGGQLRVSDQLILTSDAGTFATINYNSFYGIFLPDIRDIPSSLVMSVTDAPFSNPIDLPIPIAAPLAWDSPAVSQTLGNSTTVRWTAGDPEQSYIKFTMSFDEIDLLFNNLTCLAVDDGEFSIADFVAQVGAQVDFFDESIIVSGLNAERLGVRFIGSGDAAFEIFNSYRISVF